MYLLNATRVTLFSVELLSCLVISSLSLHLSSSSLLLLSSPSFSPSIRFSSCLLLLLLLLCFSPRSLCSSPLLSSLPFSTLLSPTLFLSLLLSLLLLFSSHLFYRFLLFLSWREEERVLVCVCVSVRRGWGLGAYCVDWTLP